MKLLSPPSRWPTFCHLLRWIVALEQNGRLCTLQRMPMLFEQYKMHSTAVDSIVSRIGHSPFETGKLRSVRGLLVEAKDALNHGDKPSRWMRVGFYSLPLSFLVSRSVYAPDLCLLTTESRSRSCRYSLYLRTLLGLIRHGVDDTGEKRMVRLRNQKRTIELWPDDWSRRMPTTKGITMRRMNQLWEHSKLQVEARIMARELSHPNWSRGMTMSGVMKDRLLIPDPRRTWAQTTATGGLMVETWWKLAHIVE